MLAIQVFVVVLALIFVGCKEKTAEAPSFWEAKKDSFPMQNLKDFVSDSTLSANYKNFPTAISATIDSLYSNPKAYLYSWQERDPSKNEFTVVVDDGEHGNKIYYLIFSKEDSLISSTQIAGKGSEGGYWFEIRSHFIAADTLSQIGAITKWLDFETFKPMNDSKGDSTFSYLIFDRLGQVKEIEVSRKFELDFEKNMDY